MNLLNLNEDKDNNITYYEVILSHLFSEWEIEEFEITPSHVIHYYITTNFIQNGEIDIKTYKLLTYQDLENFKKKNSYRWFFTTKEESKECILYISKMLKKWKITNGHK